MAFKPPPLYQERDISFIDNERNADELYRILNSPAGREAIPEPIRARWLALLDIVPVDRRYEFIRCWPADLKALQMLVDYADVLHSQGITTIYGVGAAQGLLEAFLAEALKQKYGDDRAVTLRLMDVREPEMAFADVEIYAPARVAAARKGGKKAAAGTLETAVASIEGIRAFPRSFFAADCSKAVLCVAAPYDLPVEALVAFHRQDGRNLIGVGLDPSLDRNGFGIDTPLFGDTEQLRKLFEGYAAYSVKTAGVNPMIAPLPGLKEYTGQTQVFTQFVLIPTPCPDGHPLAAYHTADRIDFSPSVRWEGRPLTAAVELEDAERVSIVGKGSHYTSPIRKKLPRPSSGAVLSSYESEKQHYVLKLTEQLMMPDQNQALRYIASHLLPGLASFFGQPEREIDSEYDRGFKQRLYSIFMKAALQHSSEEAERGVEPHASRAILVRAFEFFFPHFIAKKAHFTSVCERYIERNPAIGETMVERLRQNVSAGKGTFDEMAARLEKMMKNAEQAAAARGSSAVSLAVAPADLGGSGSAAPPAPSPVLEPTARKEAY